MDPILKICKKYNVKVIEDAAEVIGLKYKNRMWIVWRHKHIQFLCKQTNYNR